MPAFLVESATHHSEGRSERKNLWGDEQVRVFGPHRMPINAVSRDGNLRYQVGARQGNAVRREAAKGDVTDHPIVFVDLPGV